MNKGFKLTVLFFATILFCSCISNKKSAYLQDIQSVEQPILDSAIVFTKPLIHLVDILSINIFTHSPQNGSIINQAAGKPKLMGNTNTSLHNHSTGFLVNKNGETELSFIWKLETAGSTTYIAWELMRDPLLVISGKNTPIYNFLSPFDCSFLVENKSLDEKCSEIV